VSETEQEKLVINLLMWIFNEESPKLIDRNAMPKELAELYDKSLFAGIGTAVVFLVGKGDSLSTSELVGLLQGEIPDAYAEDGFWRLLKHLPQVENDEDKRNFCFRWFYVGIKVAIDFTRRKKLSKW
jgi:hypothetical protein